MIAPILIVLFIILIYTLINTCKNVEGFKFESDELLPFFLRNGITFDTDTKHLIKNNVRKSYKNHFNSREAIKLSRNKMQTNSILRQHNIPVLKSVSWGKNKPKNINRINSLKFPVVVKPIAGTQGKDIFMNLQNTKQVMRAVNSILPDDVMIEEQYKGDVFRVLIFKNKIIDIYKKTPPYVVGNGLHGVYDLIQKKRTVDEKTFDEKYAVNIDPHTIQTQLTSIYHPVPYGKKIYITNVANLHNGAKITTVDLSSVHPTNMDLFLNATQAVGLNLNGLDFISTDLSVPNNGVVLENNSTPGITGHVMVNPSSINKLIGLIFD